MLGNQTLYIWLLMEDFIHVFNLGKPDGTFETSPSSEFKRNYGFPSFICPDIGDLIVIDRGTSKVLYQIESVKSTVPRYEDVPEYMFWVGVMKDVIASNNLTHDIISVLKQNGLA